MIFPPGNIFHGVDVKEAVVDILNVVYSVLLMENVQWFLGIGPIARIFVKIIDEKTSFTCRQLLDRCLRRRIRNLLSSLLRATKDT